MSKIEKAAHPHLAAMIRGQTTTLSPTAQSQVSVWVAKTIITASIAVQQPVGYGWREHLHTHQTPPPGWNVWIGRYDGANPFRCDLHDISADSPHPLGTIAHGIDCTIVLGYFAAKVLAVRFDALPAPVPTAMISIWPPAFPSSTWPPPHSWNDASLEDLLYMFFTRKPGHEWIPPVTPRA